MISQLYEMMMTFYLFDLALDVLRLIVLVFRRIPRIICLADLDFLRLVNLRPPNMPCLSGLPPKLNVSMNCFSLVLGVGLACSAGVTSVPFGSSG